MTRPEQTDWDRYYGRPFWTAGFTRRLTGRRLLGAIRRHLPSRPPGELVVLELGGAGGSFFEMLSERLTPGQYHVVDKNRAGLSLLGARRRPGLETVVHHCDVRDCRLPVRADVVFSVGLVEHFPSAETSQVIATHFRLVSPGGLVIITFPTPTPLYCLARRLAEGLGLWMFPDERPLDMGEVLDQVRQRGRLLERGIIWPIVYTQGLVAVQAGPGPAER